MRFAPPRATGYAPLAPIAGALCAFALAAIASGFDSSGRGAFLTVVCYLAAILIFGFTSVSLRPSRVAGESAMFADLSIAGSRRLMYAGGLVLAIGINAVGYELVYRSVRDPQVSNVPGPVLWCLSLTILIATSLLPRAGRKGQEAWEPGRVPAAPRTRWLFLGVLSLLLVLAVAARFIGLADIPRGINADEGDRAATAISILRGYDTASIFSSGWFYISNFYFWLLAGVLRILGIGYAQARAFGALASSLTFVVTLWIAFRHFGARVAVLTGVLAAVLAVSLQFARETTEATQTALLWSVSVALILEAARRSRPWMWVLSGITGALSIYFYPSGRLWAVLAAAACAYLLFWTSGRRRWDIVLGAALMAISAIMTVSPFFANIAVYPDQLSQRAQQTSIFTGKNPIRLAYYDPHWGMARLVWAQIQQSLGIFSKTADGGGFWPTDRPIMWGLLSIVTYIGIGWASLNWRDPRKLILAIWFWVGFVGVIVTVETPNVQRMATAVPALPLLCALVLDECAGRLEVLAVTAVRALSKAFLPSVTALTVLIAGLLAWQQWNFYFVDYAASDRWPQPTVQGRAVADQGPNALVISLGRESHMVNSGWVRLMAPNADRGGLRSPGSALPLALPADRDLAFLIYPAQEYYLPYLEKLYPGGTVRRYRHPTEGLVVTVYRVPRSAWTGHQGTLARVGGGVFAHVRTFGDLPPHVRRFPAHATWIGQLRVPQYWTYDIRVTGGPSQLRIDGSTVLNSTSGAVQPVRLTLSRGLHLLQLNASVTSPTQVLRIEWKAEPAVGTPPTAVSPTWQLLRSDELSPGRALHGLVGTVSGGILPNEKRLDGTLATCCLADDVSSGGSPFTAIWKGSLTIPHGGTYPMSFFSQGLLSVRIDGRQIGNTTQTADTSTRVRPYLRAGTHAIRIEYTVQGTPGGLEWTWTPPGQPEQIVPPSVLRPPAGAGIGTPVQGSGGGRLGMQPVDPPLDVIQ